MLIFRIRLEGNRRTANVDLARTIRNPTQSRPFFFFFFCSVHRKIDNLALKDRLLIFAENITADRGPKMERGCLLFCMNRRHRRRRRCRR